MAKGNKVKASAAAAAARAKPSNSPGAITRPVIVGIVVIIIAFFLAIPRPESDGPFELFPYDAGIVNVSCSDKYDVINGCSPSKCARVVVANFASPSECARLRELVNGALAITGGGAGPPSILDLNSGALSAGENFMDVYHLIEQNREKVDLRFNQSNVQLFRDIVTRVKAHVQDVFGLRKLYHTTPMFFSRIDANKDVRTLNDEYYHHHVDTVQYGSFVYTALVYLNDPSEFTGGAFAFKGMDAATSRLEDSVVKEMWVEPSLGMLNVFTSGEENTHRVAKVKSGRRFALTIAFTCNPKLAVKGDLLPKMTARMVKS